MSRRKRNKKQEIKPNNKKLSIILSLAVGLFAIVIYFNSAKNGFVLDDFSVIKENLVTKKGFNGINEHIKNTYRYGYWNKQDYVYRPLSLIMFAAEWELWPDNPTPGHIINILLYALTGIVLFFVLQIMFKSYSIFFPFIISLLFISHPLHTEVVANIKSRDEILSFLLSFSSILLLLKYIESKKIIQFTLSIIVFFIAYTAKEGTILFMAIIPLILYFFTNLKLKNIIIYSSIYIVPTIIYLTIRYKITNGASVDVSVIDNLLMATNSFAEKSATAFVILGMYLKLLIAPFTLAADYSYNQIPIVNWSSWKAILSLFIYLTLIYLAVKGLKKKTILSFSIFFFFISISLYSNLIIVIGSSFAERFMYLASLGFLIGIIERIYYYSKNSLLDNNISFKQFLLLKPTIALFIVLMFFSYKTISRNTDWKSNLTLYSADVNKSPNSAHMRYYYGLVVMKDLALEAKTDAEKNKFLKEAAENFSKAKEIYPTYADAYEQLGLAYFRLGENQKSLENYQISLKYNPYKSVTYSNMGIIYFNAKKYEKALEVYEKAVELNSKNIDALFNLGSTYGTIKQFDKAINTFKKVVALDPNHATAYYYIALTYSSVKNNTEALKYYKIANSLDPKFTVPK